MPIPLSAPRPSEPAPLRRVHLAHALALLAVVFFMAAGLAAFSLSALGRGAAPLAAAAVATRQPRAFLPLIERTTVSPPSGIRRSDFGLVWVNSAEPPHAGPQRIQRGVNTGAKLDRFPIYWQYIEASPGQFDWTNQDAALAANESQGLDTLGILFGVPGFHTTAPSGPQRTEAAPVIGGSFLGRPTPTAPGTPGPPPELPPDALIPELPWADGSAAPEAWASAAAAAPQGCTEGQAPPLDLYQKVFTDGTDIPGPGKRVNPANPWADFVYRAVNRYRPGGAAGLHVRYWEVWNEPDLCKYWAGTAEQYARLLKVAYLAARQADPAAYIIWGGLTHYADDGQRTWLKTLVRTLHDDPQAAAFGGFFDAAAGHHYAIVWNGYLWTAQVRAILDSAGWRDKPIWITESGVPVCNDYPFPGECPSPWRGSPEEQASYMWQNVAYTRLAGGGPIFQFNLHDDCGNGTPPNSPDGFGLVKNEPGSACSPANAEPRLSYSAFTLADRYFAGTDLLWADIQPASSPRARRVAFYDPATHERRTLVFALDADVTVHLPATGGSARRISLDGSEMALAPVAGEYQVALNAPTNLNSPKPEGGYDVGIYGVPYLLIERDTLPPAGSIDPLPVTSGPSFDVTWHVTDLGSGLANIVLYYQKDDGPWQPWWSDVPAPGPEATTRMEGTRLFAGEPGHHYRLGAPGTDRAGNVGAPVALAETWTGTPPSFRVTGGAFDVRGLPASGAFISIGGVTSAVNGAGGFDLTVPAGTWDVIAGGRLAIRGRRFMADTTQPGSRPAPGHRLRA